MASYRLLIFQDKSNVSPDLYPFETYAQARQRAIELSSGPYRDKAVRVVTDRGDNRAPTVVAVVMNGRVTNANGTGPDVDPDA